MILTSTVKIKSKAFVLLPVKTDKEISHNEISDAMKIINSLELKAPVRLGDVIVKNFVREGINLVATKTIGE